ncbi:MAG: Na+/glucose cotransporter, partial [Phycisphaerales bacterium]
AVDTPMKLKSVFPDFKYAEGSFLWIVNNIYFQYYSVLIFLTCSIVMIAVSYATAAPDYDKIRGLTFATQTAEDRRQSRMSWTKGDVVFTCVVLALILAAYIYFSG